MKLIIKNFLPSFLYFISAFFMTQKAAAQCAPCGAITFTVNLSSQADTAWVQNGPVRSGTCCTGSNCVNVIAPQGAH